MPGLAYSVLWVRIFSHNQNRKAITLLGFGDLMKYITCLLCRLMLVYLVS